MHSRKLYSPSPGHINWNIAFTKQLKQFMQRMSLQSQHQELYYRKIKSHRLDES